MADDRWRALAFAVEAALGDASTVELDVETAPYTTYRVGGPAALAVVPADEAALVRLGEVLRADVADNGPIDVLVVGKGSNLLVADRGFEGVVVRLGDGFGWVEVDAGGASVSAGAAAALPVVARRTAAAGLTGFEWAVGVPGSVGGAVRMNAGGHGSDVAASLRAIRVVELATGQTREMAAAELGLQYRHSGLAATSVVVAATFDLAHGDAAVAEAEVSSIVTWRRENQPGGANAGSVFTNPPGDSAGRLIDAAGGKGLAVGTAAVSEKHANFIQASPGGSADDVVEVMRRVVDLVERHSGVRLRAETRLAGYPEDVLAELGAEPAAGRLG